MRTEQCQTSICIRGIRMLTEQMLNDLEERFIEEVRMTYRLLKQEIIELNEGKKQ